MDLVQMMSTNAVMDSVSLFSTPVTIMTTVEINLMNLAVVSNISKEQINNRVRVDK